MMDMYFETSSDMMSLDEMLDGDIKYSLEFGVELMKEGLVGGITGGGLSDDYWNDWGEETPPSLSLDLLAVETGPGLMVNPKSVIPVKPYSHYNVEVKEALKAEKRDTLINQGLNAKNELDFKQEEEEEDEEEEVEDEEETDEDGVEEVEENDDEEEEDEEEEDDEEEDEEEEEEEDDDDDDDMETIIKNKYNMAAIKSLPSTPQSSVWNSVSILKPKVEPEVKTHHPSFIRVKPFETLRVSGGKPASMMINKPKRPQLKMQPTFIKVKQMESLMKQHNLNQSQKAKMKANQNKNNSTKFIEDYPKPAYSYSCLIAMALKNSVTGSLPVSEIYNFMCEHFPYFISAQPGWKNSVRHNLSLNKCFEKIEKGNSNGVGCRKGYLWAMNPNHITKMDNEVAKWSRKDPYGIRRAMRWPDDLEKLERGELKKAVGVLNPREDIDEIEEAPTPPAAPLNSYKDDSDIEQVEEEEIEEVEEETEEIDDNDRIVAIGESDSEDEGEVPPSLKPFDSRLADTSDFGIEISEEMYEELGLLQEVMNSEEDIIQSAKRQRLHCVIPPSVHRQPVRPV